MSNYRNLGQVKNTALFITRHNWFFPYYELTDGQFIYGKLSYKGSFRRYAVIQTAGGTFTIKRKGWFNRTSWLYTNEDRTIGSLIPQLWSRDVTLKMDDGFEATLVYKKLFAKNCIWTNDQYGDMVNIQLRLFSIKKPYNVSFEKLLPQAAPSIPLLALLGVNLLLLRQAKAALASN